MRRTQVVLVAGWWWLSLIMTGFGAETREPLLKDLAPGLVVTSSTALPAQQLKSLAGKLGGRVERISNSILKVHGRAIQVNVVTAEDEESAIAIHATLSGTKPEPYSLRQGRTVIEYVGRDIEPGFARKTSYELGLLPKPKAVRYQVRAELATVDTADYMASNPLCNYIRMLQQGENQEALDHIKELSGRFTFGSSLVLRRAASEETTYRLRPAESGRKEAGSTVSCSFDRTPTRHGIPYVTAEMEILVDDSGASRAELPPGPALTAATDFWPVDDPRVQKLAGHITRGQVTNQEKAQAILEWLTPGKNIESSGQTGSRWGTIKVLEQKFGHCWDSSDCFVTLGRAAGVPCRQVAGWLYAASGHVWAEFYSEGRWQQVDPTGGGDLRCGIYHIPYFTTEDGDMPILYVSMPTIEVLSNE